MFWYETVVLTRPMNKVNQFVFQNNFGENLELLILWSDLVWPAPVKSIQIAYGQLKPHYTWTATEGRYVTDLTNKIIVKLHEIFAEEFFISTILIINDYCNSLDAKSTVGLQLCTGSFLTYNKLNSWQPSLILFPHACLIWIFH